MPTLNAITSGEQTVASANPVDVFFNTNFFGIPVWLIIAFFVGICIFIWKRKPKPDKVPTVNVKKETNRHIKKLFDTFGVPTNKHLSTGTNRFKYVLSTTPLFWNSKAEPVENLKNNRTIATVPEVKKAVESEASKGNDDFKELYGLKVCPEGFLTRRLSKLFGLWVEYFIVDKELLTFNSNEVILNPFSSPEDLFDITIFSKVGRKKVEDYAFKLSREIDLNEMVNFVLKLTYLETHHSKGIEELNAFTKIKEKGKEDYLERIVNN